MKSLRWLPLAALLLPLSAAAQSAGCPELPSSGGLSWDTLDGPDFTYCKAMREDGTQAFAVMLREDAQFRPRRSQREQEVLIDGHQVHWYRGEVPMEPTAIVRETLVELDGDNTAHITLRAYSETQLAETLPLAEGLRFRDARLGSN